MSILENLSAPWINALAWTLVHSIWQIMILALVLKIAIALSGKAAAKIRHAFSLGALLAIPALAIYTFLRQYLIYKNAQSIAFIEFQNTLSVNVQEQPSWFVVQKSIPETLRFIENYTSEIFWIYMTGILITSTLYIFSLLDVWRLKTRDTQPVPESWQKVINKMQDTFKVYFKHKIFLSARTSIPVVAGFFKPVILFPAAIAGSLTLDEVEHVLLHEMYHIKCKDHYINTFQFIIEVLFFYHPLTWWISVELKKEREKRVDEWVVSNSSQPLEYANTLFKLEKSRKETPLTAVAASSSKNSLLIRIKNILHMKTRNFKPMEKSFVILTIALAIVSLAWLNPPKIFVMAEDSQTGNYQPYADNPGWVSAPMTESQDAPEPNPMSKTAIQTESAEPSTPDQPDEPQDQPDEKPERIVMQNGKYIGWDELSDKEKEEIEKAIKEANIALEQANIELNKTLNSEEFKEQMRTINESVHLSMKEAHRAMVEEWNSEEFQEEMEKAKLEIKQAMKEVNSEEFQKEIETAMQEAQKAIREARIEWKTEMESEEFKEEMRKAQQEIRDAMKEIEMEFNSEEFQQEMKNIQFELGQASEEWNAMMQDEEFQKEMEELSVELEKLITETGELTFESLGLGMEVLFEGLSLMGNMMIDSMATPSDSIQKPKKPIDTKE